MTGKNEPLYFHPDSSFRIVQLTDLHITNGGAEDRKTLDLVGKILDWEKPDLVVLTGDIIEGKRCADPAKSWLRAVEPIERRSLPWASVFGNHDDEGVLSRSELMRVQQSCEHCLSEFGPENIPGVGNYTLTVRNAPDNSIGAVLYLIDSNSYARDGLEGYGWIEKEQIDWYLTNAADFTSQSPDGNPMPAFAFFHIPIPEYNDVWNQGNCKGEKNEDVCAPAINTGMFKAFCQAGDVVGVFVGHEHINDFEGDLNGIRLCYGRGGGYGTYGKKGFRKGARMIEIRSGDRDFKTWIRLDNIEG